VHLNFLELKLPQMVMKTRHISGNHD